MGALSGQITTLSGLRSTQQAQSGMYSNLASLGFGLTGAAIKFGPRFGGQINDMEGLMNESFDYA